MALFNNQAYKVIKKLKDINKHSTSTIFQQTVVRVSQRCLSIDLEVLVASYWLRQVNRSPICKWSIFVVEPLLTNLFEVLRINVGNTSCNLWLGYMPVKVQELGSNLLHHIRAWLESEQLWV